MPVPFLGLGDPRSRPQRAEKYLTSPPPACVLHTSNCHLCNSSQLFCISSPCSTKLSNNPLSTPLFSKSINQNDWWRQIWRQGLWLQERSVVSTPNNSQLLLCELFYSHTSLAVPPRPVWPSLLVVSTVSCARATMPSVLVLVPPSTWPLFLSTLLPKSSNWLVTPLATTRRHVSSPVIFSWPFETTRS